MKIQQCRYFDWQGDKIYGIGMDSIVYCFKLAEMSYKDYIYVIHHWDMTTTNELPKFKKAMAKLINLNK